MVPDTITPQQSASGARSRALFGLAALLLVLVVPSPAAARLIDEAVTAQACTMTGDGGADRLDGTGGRDVMCGLGGRDRLRGNGGHDVVLGGGGGDLLQGKAGSDRLDGGPGNDRAFGGAGADDIFGRAGNDVLGGGLGPDDMSGGSGRDVVVYGQRGVPVIVTIGAGANDGVARERDNVKADVESVQGGRGNDVLTGNGRANRLFGGGGNDRLLGKGGSDVLSGAGGDDRLDAREGAAAAGHAAQAGAVDRVVCGGGNDTALVDPVDQVGPDCENVVGGAPATPPPAGNRAPTGIALSNESVAENQPVGTTVGTLSAGDPDPGDTHSFALVPGQGSDDNGSFQIVGNTLRTNAVFNYEAKSTYTVRIRATDFGTPAGQIVRAFTITVTDVNDPPTAVDDAASVPENSAATPLAVLANDSDPDGDPVTIASASDPAHGTVVLTGGLPGAHTGLTYQPDLNYCSATPDTFTYTLNGGSTATVSVTVDCGDAPTAVNDSATVAEDSAAGAIDVLANDTDTDGGAKAIASASDPANGMVVLTGGSAGAHTGLTYQPDAELSAGRTRSRTRSTAARRPPCRSPSRVSTTRRWRSTTARAWLRTRRRARSPCWPMTPTSMAGRCRWRR